MASQRRAIEIVVSLSDGSIVSWTEHEGMRPALLFGESMHAIIKVKEHPDWFHIRPDGSIAYAENPPKKYQDIFPVNFWSRDRENLCPSRPARRRARPGSRRTPDASLAA